MQREIMKNTSVTVNYIGPTNSSLRWIRFQPGRVPLQRLSQRLHQRAGRRRHSVADAAHLVRYPPHRRSDWRRLSEGQLPDLPHQQQRGWARERTVTAASDPDRSQPERCAPGGQLRPGANFFKPYSQYLGGLTVLQSRDYSNYNALQIQVERRMLNGFLITANYTYSKALDVRSFDPAFTILNATGTSTSQFVPAPRSTSTTLHWTTRRLTSMTRRYSTATSFINCHSATASSLAHTGAELWIWPPAAGRSPAMAICKRAGHILLLRR